MTLPERRTIIGIMGGADPRTPEEILVEAETAGRLIAESGAVLLCGGRTGVMEAAARGAKSVPGGETLAILPGSDPDAANPYIDLAVATGMGNGRNIINVLSSDAIIAFHGGAGTLSEIALAVKCGIHIVSFSNWDLAAARTNTPDAALDRFFHKAAGAEEAVAMALGHARAPLPQPEEIRERILNVLLDRDRSWNQNDRERLLKHYVNSSELTVILGNRRISGIKAFISYLEERRKNDPVLSWEMHVDPESLRINRLPGRCFAATYSCRIEAEGEETVYCRTTGLFVRQEGMDRLVQEHLSLADRAPADRDLF